MADHAKLDYIRQLLDEMADRQLRPDGQGLSQKGLQKRVQSLRDQLAADEAEAKGKVTTDEAWKKFDKNVENLAKALPGVVKGVISADNAFKKGDAFGGSAAIMDICASLAPLLGGLSAAGGPPGMLVGAIFAMVGQILSLFVQPPEPLPSQIEAVLRKLEGEMTQQRILTVHQQIKAYASSLRKAATSASKWSDDPALNIMVTRDIVKAINLLEGNTVTSFMNVMNWLNEPNNQTLDAWPTVLSIACQAWADMMAAALTLLSLVHTDHTQRQYDKAKDDRQIQRDLKELQAHVISRLVILSTHNDILLPILKELVPAAQNRGMFWMIADNWHSQLYAGTHIKQGEFPYLGGEQKRISVVVPGRDINSPHPTYYLLGLEPWGTGKYDRTYIGEVKPPYDSVHSLQLSDENGKDHSGFHLVTDICVEPGFESHEILFYTAKEQRITGYVVDLEKGMNKARATGYTRDLKSKVASVRVLHNPQAFVDDPDNIPSILTGVDSLVYAGLARENSEIYVNFGDGQSGYVPSPWQGYDGIGVDQHYVWVFGSGGFACATHTSVIRCLKEKNSAPRWMTHYPNDLLYEGKQDYSPPPESKPLRGLVDLCPCDDGTLVAAIYRRSVEVDRIYGSYPHTIRSYKYVDHNALYSAVYQTDLKHGTIDVKWTRIEVSTGVRVEKLPVFCWSLLKSLPVSLEQLAPQLASL